ncbi:hypothetical protein AM228_12685 [Planktothricoides sp. SR001]|nr:hypothetical protein AM228_12685 [Planktothricoides sp. SR001]
MNSGSDPEIFGKNTDLSRLSAVFFSCFSIYTDLYLAHSLCCNRLFSIEMRIRKYCSVSNNQDFTPKDAKNAAIASNDKLFKLT